ncbi:hypothetical protein [Flagellimonas pacifica]|uniref:DUF1579 domain-containing protein n=1 Tax=Flagellimonas pacifica TaxID=1247520 RepID=A0A285MSM0_9FLAO|nr:hypothetical protein [Allomuricauda parva]SNZ00190.1 hypothetical protein SAMN06265377_2010 [Allomuricauda parva]
MKKLFGILVFMFSFLMNAQTDSSCNCCTEEYRAFDFWVGTWEVVKTDGSNAGKNLITKEEEGCVIRENWTSASPGYTGTSLNFYNAATKQWEQLWIDNTGNFLKLKGNRVGNQMILASSTFAKDDGKNYRNRITWTKNNDGTVRQLWEVLEGDTVVNVVFDGLYKRK